MLSFTIYIVSLRGEGFDLDQNAEYPNNIIFFSALRIFSALRAANYPPVCTGYDGQFYYGCEDEEKNFELSTWRTD